MIPVLPPALALALFILPVKVSDRDLLVPAAGYTATFEDETGLEAEITATLADGGTLTFPVPGCRPVDLVWGADHHTYRGFRFRKHIGSRWTWVILNLEPGDVRAGLRFTVELDGEIRTVRVLGREGRGYRLEVPPCQETVR